MHAELCSDARVPPVALRRGDPGDTCEEPARPSPLRSRSPDARVRYDIEPTAQGCELRWTLLDVDDPGPALVGHMCKRLNQLINAELRYSFGQ